MVIMFPNIKVTHGLKTFRDDMTSFRTSNVLVSYVTNCVAVMQRIGKVD